MPAAVTFDRSFKISSRVVKSGAIKLNLNWTTMNKMQIFGVACCDLRPIFFSSKLNILKRGLTSLFYDSIRGGSAHPASSSSSSKVVLWSNRRDLANVTFAQSGHTETKGAPPY